MPDEMNDSDALYCPYLAAIEGRDAASQQKFFERFAQQPRDIRTFIASEDTGLSIRELVVTGIVPAQYGVAVAKIVALLAIEEIQSGQVVGLLEKLGLTPQQAADAERAIVRILEPVVAARARGALPTQLPELPPLTQRIPPMNPAADSSKTPARNIIDLRK